MNKMQVQFCYNCSVISFANNGLILAINDTNQGDMQNCSEITGKTFSLCLHITGHSKTDMTILQVPMPSCISLQKGLKNVNTKSS